MLINNEKGFRSFEIPFRFQRGRRSELAARARLSILISLFFLNRTKDRVQS